MRKVQLGDMLVIEEPFHRVAIDLIGPIIPVYPEDVALAKTDTETIAEALLEIYSRVRFPSEVLSDRGSHEFTADLMKEVDLHL